MTTTAPPLLPLAAHGLAGSMFDMATGPFAPAEWFDLVQGCQATGLTGTLAAAVHRGDVQLSPAQTEELGVLENEAAGLSLLVEQRAVRLSALLTAAGVAHRLLGGAARARLGYRQPGIRIFQSATMLVEPRGLEVTAAPRGMKIESALHHPGLRSIGLDDLADPPTLLTLAEQPVPTASIEEHLVLACLDVASSWSRDLADPRGMLDLVAQRDVAELALFPAIDPVRVQQTAEQWSVVETVAAAVVEVWQLFDLADRTRLSVWAYRVADPPVPGRNASASSRGPSHPHPDRRAASGGGTRLGRMVNKLAPGNAGAKTSRRVR